MTGSPADHPAVVNPQAVTATGAVLAAPVLAAPAVVGQQSPPARNEAEQLLRDIYPGKMNSVKIEPFDKNPNPIAKAPMKGEKYAAWTQSERLIYYDHDEKKRDLFAAFVLRHEGSHVLQFQKGTGHPSDFMQMLSFEAQSYSSTAKWLEVSKPQLESLGFDPDGTDKEDYDSLLHNAKANGTAVTSIYLKSIAHILGQFATRVGAFLTLPVAPANVAAAAPGMTADRIAFLNMEAADYVPLARRMPKSDPDTGVTQQIIQYYTAKDMYRDGKSDDDHARWKSLGF